MSIRIEQPEADWIAGLPTDQQAAARAWLERRPAGVRALAIDYPMLTRVHVDDAPVCLVVGWTEEGSIIISPIDPRDDYDASMGARIYLCGSCAKAARAHLR